MTPVSRAGRAYRWLVRLLHRCDSGERRSIAADAERLLHEARTQGRGAYAATRLALLWDLVGGGSRDLARPFRSILRAPGFAVTASLLLRLGVAARLAAGPAGRARGSGLGDAYLNGRPDMSIHLKIIVSLVAVLASVSGVLLPVPETLRSSSRQGSSPANRGPIATVPPKRAHHAMAFDRQRNEVVLYGGSTAAANDASTFFDDFWSWNGRRWHRIATPGSPRSSHRLLYDSARRQLLLMGGFAGQQPFADVRAFDGKSWILVNDTPALASLLADPAVAYDTRRKRVVLFGGLKPDRTVSGETWEFDGNSWARVEAAGPGPLQSPAMVYDEARGVTLLFGGRNDKRAWNGSTWQWDGTTWRQLAADGPPPRISAGFAYDTKRRAAVLFGGLAGSGMLADTWLWDGKAWRAAGVSGPSGRALLAMAYDPRRSVVVLFGGRIKYPEDSNETWEWDGSQWKQVGER